MRLLLVIQLIQGVALALPIASIGEADDTFGSGLTGFFYRHKLADYCQHPSRTSRMAYET